MSVLLSPSQTSISADLTNGSQKSFFVLAGEGAAVGNFGDVAVSSLAFNTADQAFSDISGFWMKYKTVRDVAGNQANALAVGTPFSSTIKGTLATNSVIFMNNAQTAVSSMALQPSSVASLSQVNFNTPVPVTANSVSTAALFAGSVNGFRYSTRGPSGYFVQSGTVVIPPAGGLLINLSTPYLTTYTQAASYVNSNVSTSCALGIPIPPTGNGFVLLGQPGATANWITLGV